MTAADCEDELSRKFALLAPVLDEHQRRLWMAVEAREAGPGGITVVARASDAVDNHWGRSWSYNQFGARKIAAMTGPTRSPVMPVAARRPGADS